MARRRLAISAVVAALACEACANRLTTIVTEPPALTCDYSSPDVMWDRIADPADRTRLDLWCASVGPPRVLHGVPSSANVRRLIVVSWNMYVGGGRVGELLALIERLTPRPAGGDVGVVLLLQEAFRAGADVPESVPHALDPPAAIRPGRPTPDVLELARATGYSLAYVPSMRNGPGRSVYEREDRGSAILSSEPMSSVTAIELPFGRQRRIAVMATIDPRGAARPLRMMSGHFDILRGTGPQARRLAAFVRDRSDGPPFVIGVDTNAAFGARDSVVRAIDASVPRLTQCGERRTTRWFARPDFLFTTLESHHIVRCDTLTERYGSDHAPVVLRIDF